MKKTDLIIIGTTILCSLAGLTRNLFKHASVAATTHAAPMPATSEPENIQDTESIHPVHHVASMTFVKQSESRAEKRQRAMLAHQAQLKQNNPNNHDNIDPVEARNLMKELLLRSDSDDGIEGLSHEQKWDLIESGSMLR